VRQLAGEGSTMLRRIATTLLVTLAVAPAAAAEAPVPERRLVTHVGQDCYGGDIGSIFGTDFATCRTECLEAPSCAALTYNMRAGACFLKSGVDRNEPFDGAVSARVLETPPAVRERAGERAAELGFLPDGAIAAARELAETLGLRVEAKDAAPETLRAAAAAAERTGDLDAAAKDYAAAATLTDGAGDWRELARLWQRMAAAPLPARASQDERAARDRLRRDALSAAVNAYLRDDGVPARASSLFVLALALESRGHGREMIPALRLAEELAPRRETEELLDHALSNYGFRVVDHS